MSRIGKQPIPVPSGVEVTIEPELVRVKGPKGQLEQRISRDMKVEQEDGTIVVTRPTDRGEHRALHGLTRSLIVNMVHGVTEGYEKRLQIQGVGYRAALKGSDIELSVGYSHPVHDRGARGHRVRGAAAHADRGARASTSRPSARSRRASARCARPSPTRARASATRASTWPGRSVSAHEGRHQAGASACAAGAASAPRCAAPRSVRGCPCSARCGASRRSSSTTIKRPHRRGRHLDREGAHARCSAPSRPRRAGALLASPGEGGRSRGLRVRPRRLPVPRQGQGVGGGRSRGRPAF